MKTFKSPHTDSQYSIIAEAKEREVYIVARYLTDKNDHINHYRVAIYAPAGFLMQVNHMLHGCEWSDIKYGTHISATVTKSEYSDYLEQAFEGLRAITGFPAIFPCVPLDIDPMDYLVTTGFHITCYNCGCHIAL